MSTFIRQALRINQKPRWGGEGSVVARLTFSLVHFSLVIFEFERQVWVVLRAAAFVVHRAVGPVPANSSCHLGRDAWLVASAGDASSLLGAFVVCSEHHTGASLHRAFEASWRLASSRSALDIVHSLACLHSQAAISTEHKSLRYCLLEDLCYSHYL